jgi:hypothetical protein
LLSSGDKFPPYVELDVMPSLHPEKASFSDPFNFKLGIISTTLMSSRIP